MVPYGVGYECNKNLGVLGGMARKCRDGSFGFVKSGDAEIKVGTPTVLRSGK